jgi:hypothetical protein
MTLRLRVDGDYSGRGLPNTRPFLPGFEDRLYAGYLLGTGFGRPLGEDVSGNGRTANVAGVPADRRFPNRLSLGTGSSVVYPFTSAQMAAASGGRGTIIAVAKTITTAAAFLAGDFTLAGAGAFVLSADLTNNGRAWVVDTTTAGAVNQSVLDTGAVDAGRATRYEMLVATMNGTTIQAFRRYTGAALQAAPAYTTPKKIQGSVQPMQSGAPTGGTYPGPFDGVETLFFNNHLTAAEIDAIFALEVARLVPFGIVL